MMINLMMMFMVIFHILRATADYFIIKRLIIYILSTMNKIVDALCQTLLELIKFSINQPEHPCV